MLRCKMGLLLVAVLVGGTAICATGAEKPQMVVCRGWTTPDTQYLKLHVNEMEKRPFSGVEVYVSWPRFEGGGVEDSGPNCNLSWSVFENERFTPQMIEGAMKDVRETNFRRFKDNLMCMISYQRDGRAFNWFDDARWKTVCLNARDMARIARQGKYRGILFDAEEYGCPFWSWGEPRPGYSLKDHPAYSGKTYEQARAKVRQRGREFIKAVNKGFPGCLFWTTFAYSHTTRDRPLGDTDFSNLQMGLYFAFIDGMLEASDKDTIFVDGCEDSYRFSELEQFEGLRKVVAENDLSFTQVPDIYRKKMRVGFGLYLDMSNYEGSHPWYGDKPEENYMTPERLEKAVRNALQVSDGYVWIDSEYPSWWLDSPTATFGEGVHSRPEGFHKWIHPVYWRAIEAAQKPGQ